jgi:hypothetical protein
VREDRRSRAIRERVGEIEFNVGVPATLASSGPGGDGARTASRLHVRRAGRDSEGRLPAAKMVAFARRRRGALDWREGRRPDFVALGVVASSLLAFAGVTPGAPVWPSE